jgi:serine/threonine protein phosphatase 1
MEKVYYAIGDVHGRLDAFKELIQRINDDIQKYHLNKEVYVIQVGDLMDRGEDSKNCLEIAMNFQAYFPNNVTTITLQGNHEEIIFKLWHNNIHELQPKEPQFWFHPHIGGGIETLKSYNDVPTEEEIIQAIQENIPKSHIDFMGGLPMKFENDTYFFCHGGVDPKKPLSEQTNKDL